jgi:hypothetical protein
MIAMRNTRDRLVWARWDDLVLLILAWWPYLLVFCLLPILAFLVGGLLAFIASARLDRPARCGAKIR